MNRLSSVHSIHHISPADWQRLYRHCGGYPFLDRRFLSALEDSDCIGGEADHASGWQSCYLISRNDDDLISAILPCYIKQHSYGEYVFDWSWAEAYERYGLAYYPKLLWGTPFTPASGPRVLADNPALTPWFTAVNEFCQRTQLSGWHLNFPRREDVSAEENTGTAERHACQFHWFNRDYRDFDHYLQHFVSRKRKTVRKERQKIVQQGITLQRKTGTEISTGDIRFFFHCYQDTYRRRRSYPYLNEDFFQRLRASMSEKMMLVMAYQQQEPIACALYFMDDSTLYGRYWGALDDVDALHFEACYYQGIEFCIERGLQRFDPGTQGEHKISRGFEPVQTLSIHQLQHPGFQQAIGDFVEEEKQHILHYQQQARSLLPFRDEETDQPS